MPPPADAQYEEDEDYIDEADVPEEDENMEPPSDAETVDDDDDDVCVFILFYSVTTII